MSSAGSATSSPPVKNKALDPTEEADCNPCCCMKIEVGVRMLCGLDIIVSSVLIILLIVAVALSDVRMFMSASVLVFLGFGFASIILSIMVLCIISAWPAILWILVNTMRLLLVFALYAISAITYTATKGSGSPSPSLAVFIVMTVILIPFALLYFWFILIMIGYASYLNQKKIKANTALIFRPPTPTPSAEYSSDPSDPCDGIGRSYSFRPRLRRSSPCATRSGSSSSQCSQTFNNIYYYRAAEPPHYNYNSQCSC